MKSFIQFILEGATIGKGSPWALAKGSVGKKPKEPKNKKVKQSSVYDIGHYSKAKDMKKVKLYFLGAKTGYKEITHHEHHKQSNQRRAKAGWEGKVTPNNANHETWMDHMKIGNEHYVTGRVDETGSTPQHTVNGSNEKMEERARKHISKKYPDSKEYHISK